MNDFQRIQGLFEAALALEPDQRREYLCQACADRPDLVDDVWSLLEVATDAKQAIDRPLLSNPSLAGTSLGPYHILRELGRGGMGRVYLAEQRQPIERKVAVKFVAFWSLDRERQRRFTSEQMSLGRMNHPYIARLYETGVYEDGQPYFVMEYLVGKPITDWCDHHRADLKTRIDLFIKVCQGISHAHLKGVIHRDIKPSNVLIVEENDQPTPKIIDFGIAKTIGDTRMTHTGFSPGSFGYMSPEQAGAQDDQGQPRDQDFRTDVYSLGVLLYELLVGETPLTWPSHTSPARILTDICHKHPKRPSNLWRALDAGLRRTRANARDASEHRLAHAFADDLDWITLKALEKDPDRRYRSPADLERDIVFHLEHKPVEAGPPSLRYQLTKFVKRYRRGVLISATATVLLLSFLAVVLWQKQTISHERDRAKREAHTAASVSDFLVDLLNTGDPTMQPESTQGGDTSVRDVVGKARQTVETKLQDQPHTQLALLETLASIYNTWGQVQTALELYDEAFALQDSLGPAYDAQLGDIKAKLLHGKGRTLWQMSRLQEAEPFLRQAVEVQLSIAPNSLPTASFMNALAEWHMANREWEAASELLERSLTIAEALPEDEERVADWCRYSLARIYARTGKYVQAETNYRKVLASLTATHGPYPPQAPGVLQGLANLFMAKGEPERAIPFMTEALALDIHFNGQQHPLVAMDYFDLGIMYTQLEEPDLAEWLFWEALTQAREFMGENHPKVALILRNIGVTIGEHDPVGALGFLQESLQIESAKAQPNPESIALIHARMSENLNRLDDFATADPLIEQAIAQFQQTRPRRHDQYVRSVTTYAITLTGLGCLSQAEAALDRAQRENQESTRPSHRLGGDQNAYIQAALARLNRARGAT